MVFACYLRVNADDWLVLADYKVATRDCWISMILLIGGSLLLLTVRFLFVT